MGIMLGVVFMLKSSILFEAIFFSVSIDLYAVNGKGEDSIIL